MTKDRKTTIIEGFRKHADDTGSPEVQIALLSDRIGYLTDHFKIHVKDHHSRRGRLTMPAHRRPLLASRQSKDSKRYADVIKRLGIRK